MLDLLKVILSSSICYWHAIGESGMELIVCGHYAVPHSTLVMIECGLERVQLHGAFYK